MKKICYFGICCLKLNHKPKCKAGESVNFIETITLGIVGKECAGEKTPCVYTRVTSILDWIKDSMK